MHTETDAEVRMYNILKERMTTVPHWCPPRVYSNFKPERGTLAEYDKARTDCAEFKQAMRRQLQAHDYNALYTRVEEHCRSYRPFSGKPYRDWLGVFTAVWSRALAGELSPRPSAFHASGVQYKDLPKLTGLRVESIIIDDPINQETTVKGKKVNVPKAPKPPKKDYNTVGVRFLRGHNLHKVYTYKVAKKVKLALGEEIVVPTEFEGLETNSIAVVVELHKAPKDDYGGIYYKFVTGKISRV
jgi:hypothetical protein